MSATAVTFDASDVVRLYGRAIRVDLMYPRNDDRPNAIEIDLCEVRASDGIRVTYDFARDGWSIQQPTKLEFEPGESADDFWEEVAFAKSFANNLDKAKQKRASIEPDGVNIIDCGTVETRMMSCDQLRACRIDLLGRVRTGERYRVLLERIGD